MGFEVVGCMHVTQAISTIRKIGRKAVCADTMDWLMQEIMIVIADIIMISDRESARTPKNPPTDLGKNMIMQTALGIRA